ncbi:MAG: glycerophosphodiester phosphodiesterase, partial [Candidatus Acidiferrum sp.]
QNMRTLFPFLTVIAVFSLTLFGANRMTAAEPDMPFEFFKPNQSRLIQIVPYGGIACAAPANSRRALEMCIEDTIAWAAVDVRLSKDGIHVLHNSARLADSTNGTGQLAEKTLTQLQELDAGASFAKRFAGTRILTLREALSLAKNRLNLCLLCRQMNADSLVKEILKAGAERQVVVFTEPAAGERIRELSRGKIAIMARWTPPDGTTDWISQQRPHAVAIAIGDITAETCRVFHDHKIKVLANCSGETSDQTENWNKAISVGADWLQTDFPLEASAAAFQAAIKKRPALISMHRGANRYAPENTLFSLGRAAAAGADYIEFDIRTTKDGKHILMHDGRVNRTTNGKGPVRDQSAAELAVLDAGKWFGKSFIAARIPTFDDALTALGPKSQGYLDSKDISVEALADAMERHNLLERSVVYQSADFLKKLKKHAPKARALPPLRKPGDLDSLADLRPYGVDVDWRILSKELIAHCHERGIKVFSDALGSHEKAAEYTKAMDWGIDVIQTDHPIRLMRAMELRQSRSGAANNR